MGIRTGLVRRIAALATGALAVLAATPSVAQYVIQPGDTIRLSVSGLPELSGEAMVDIDGLLRLPQIGSVQAAGSTLDELEQEAGLRIAERPYKRFGDDGVPVFIALSADDIALDVALYRPIYVSGDVSEPGAVDYRPGLTVRSAIAAAGGSTFGGPSRHDSESDLRTEARLRGDYGIYAFEIAEMRAADWRLNAELAENPEPEAPGTAGLPVPQEVFDDIVANHRERLKANLAQLARDREFLAEATDQADDRIAILKEQQENQRTAVQFDEEEVERVSALFDRGIVPINRLVDIRRAQLSSATRLLQTEDGLSKITLDRTRFQNDLAKLEEERRSRILEEIGNARARGREAHARFTSTSEQLAAMGANVVTEVKEPVILVFRDDSKDGFPAAMDVRLMPGDIVDVMVPDPLFFAGQ